MQKEIYSQKERHYQLQSLKFLEKNKGIFQGPISKFQSNIFELFLSFFNSLRYSLLVCKFVGKNSLKQARKYYLNLSLLHTKRVSNGKVLSLDIVPTSLQERQQLQFCALATRYFQIYYFLSRRLKTFYNSFSNYIYNIKTIIIESSYLSSSIRS